MPGNPYRGLECFEAEHAALYFGRERTARELLERLEAHPLVALIGVAGSGKSSLVRAGRNVRVALAVRAEAHAQVLRRDRSAVARDLSVNLSRDG